MVTVFNLLRNCQTVSHSICFCLFVFLAALGLCHCAWAFSSCSEWGLLFVAVCGLLLAVASLVVEHRLQVHGLSSCGSRAQLLHGMWDLPGPGIKPVSPALTGGFLTITPAGKSLSQHLETFLHSYQQCMRVPNSLHPPLNLIIVYLFGYSHPSGC